MAASKELRITYGGTRKAGYYLSNVAMASPIINPAHLATEQFANPFTDS